MRAADIIIKKRGTKICPPQELKQEEINFMVEGYTTGSIPDYQMSAFLMAVYFSGMTFKETGYLTQAMLHSGDVINLYSEKYKNLNLHGPFVDKHSTGGVGDKISLPLAPIIASLGLQVPMMSGRGLGHTGGTLDKLESIEGYNVVLPEDTFASFISENNYAMTGQTEKIAPADRKMYALRDVTGTVESIPLITASILSKKIAEGSDALVFDVKFGTGAFMKTKEDAEALATSLVKTAQSMGKKAVALITKMESPLGFKTGNFLEIEETLECLCGEGPEDIMELTFQLGAQMLILGGIAKDINQGIELCRRAVTSGKALEYFLKNVDMQGGNSKKLMEQKGVRRSKFREDITSEQDGYINIDAYKTGIACINLGVGRNKTTDKVDADSGIIFKQTNNSFVKKGQVIMEVYGRDQESLQKGVESLKDAISYSDKKAEEEKLIWKIIC